MATRTADERVNRWEDRRVGNSGDFRSNKLEFDEMSPSSGEGTPEQPENIQRTQFANVRVQEYDGPTFEERERQEYVFVEDVGDWRSEFRDSNSVQNSLENIGIQKMSEYHISTQTKDQLEGVLKNSKKTLNSVHQDPPAQKLADLHRMQHGSTQKGDGYELVLQSSQHSLPAGLNSLKKQQTGVSQDSFVWSAKSLHSFEPLSLGMTNQSLEKQLAQAARPAGVPQQIRTQPQQAQQSAIMQQQRFELHEGERSSAGDTRGEDSDQKR